MAVSNDVQKVVDAQKTPDYVAPPPSVTLTHAGSTTSFATIQAAVNAAVSGDTINIAAGTYLEQVTVANFTDLTIIGAPGAIVRSPAGALAANGATSDYGGPVYANIAVNNSSGVTIRGLTVDGDFAGDRTVGVGAFNGATDEISGITFINSSGAIDGVTVRNISNSTGGGLFGLQLGSAIFVDGVSAAATSVSITGSTITDFQKTGLLLLDANVTVTGNTITGIGFTTLTAQNAIQLGDGQGTISGNTIASFGYDSPPGGPVYEGAGVIVYDQTGGVTISNNVFSGSGAEGFAGAFIEDVNGFTTTVSGNTVSNTTYGFYIYNADATPDNPTALSGNTFNNVANAPVIVQDANTIYNVTNATQLANALASAADGDVINLAAGTYAGNFAITHNVTINGANRGVAGTATRGAESIIDGAVTANAGVTIDGVQFLNSSNNATDFNALTISGALNASVTNSVFYSTGPNGNNDRAITMDTSATGQVTISNNYFTGASTGQFSTASWSRGIWSDGAANILSIGNNTFEYVRTGLNLDGYNNGATNIFGNQFVASGTGISIGTPTTTTITGIHDNVFTNVNTDFNLRNVTIAQSFDLTATNNVGGGTGAAAQLYVLGTADGDTLTGSAGDDILDARDSTSGSFFDTAANTLNGGGGNDLLIGSRGNDTLNGGMGNDTAVIVANGGTDSFNGGAGTDTLDLRGVGAVTATANGATTTYSYAGGSVAATGVENVLYTGSLTVSGGATDDTITTGDGNETLNGNDGNDTLESGGGNDFVYGGNGNDTIIGGDGAGDDFYDGGPGIDLLTYPSTSQGVFVDMNAIDRSGDARVAAILTGAGLPTNTPVGIATGPEIGVDAFRNIENVTGGSGNDTIYGDGGANTIDGSGGDDVIRGGLGNDTLIGGTGFDILDYSTRTAAVQVNLISGQVNAGVNDLDTVSGFENILLGSADDQFIGSTGDDVVTGNAGNDQLDGRAGRDIAVYVNSVAADGQATQVFSTLQFNAGINGTDQLTNFEVIRFVNALDVLDIAIDNGNAVVASRDDAGAQNEGDTTLTRTAATGVLSNDINLDQGGADLKYVFAVNGSTTNVGQPIVGTYGTLTLNADGSYTYVQNQSATNSLRGGQTVTDTFTYQADDNDTGDSATANLVFTITGVNDAPTTGGTQTGSVTEDTNVEAGNVLPISGTLTVTDPDAGESAYQAQTVTGTYGSFTLQTNGQWTYQLNNSATNVQALGAGVAVTDGFTALTVDNTAVPVTITVNGTNDNPVITGTTFVPFAPLPFGVLTDAAGSANNSFATAINLDSSYVLTLNNDIGNSTTVPHVTINGATNGGSPLETDYFRFTVATTGTAVFDTDNTTGYTNGSFLGDTRIRLFNSSFVQIGTSDDNAGDPGSVGPNFNANSLLSITLNPGVYYVTVAAFDTTTTGGTYQLHVSLPGGTLGGAPRPGNLLTETNAALTTSGNVTFTDVDTNDSPVASYSAATGFTSSVLNGPALTTAQATALASAFSITSGGAFTFTTPSPDFLGHDDVLTLTYTVTVDDQHGGSATTPVTITINGTNDAPVITSTAQGATLTETNAALSASGAVIASDADNGDVLVYSGGPVGVSVTGTTLTVAQQNALTGAFSVDSSGAWTYNLASPDFLPAGSIATVTARVNVADGHGGTTFQNVVIVVNGANDAPAIQTNVEHSYTQMFDEPLAPSTLTDNGQVLFTDADNGSTPTASYAAATDATVTATGLTLSAAQISAIAASFAVTNTNGTYSFNLASPEYLAAGDVITAVFNVHVRDGAGGDTVQAITYTITGTNDAPVLTGGSLGTIADTVNPDTFAPVTGTIAGAATDIDNHDTKTFTLNGPATSAYGTLTLNADGTYSFAVNSAAVNGLLTTDVRTVTYSVTVTDSGNLTSTADFTFTITGQNENPVLATSPLNFYTADYGYTETFNLLTGASDPDNVEMSDLDISNVSVTGYTTNGALTPGQLSLLNSAVNNAFSNASFDTEAGTLSFNTGLFDFLDEDQSVTVTLTYTVLDSNGGSVSQTANVTIDGILEFNSEGATPFDDYLVGGNFGDLVFAQDGDDEVYAGAGADRIYGEGGDDYLDGGSGNDTLIGGEGDDAIFGGSGNDTLYGDEPFLFGGEGGFAIGDNTIDGGSGNDTIYGGLGNNVINAGSGNDDIYIGSAGFLLGGEGGWDTEEGGAKPQFIGGGEGGIEVDLPSGMNIVDGGSGFDTVHVSGQWSDYTITRVAANTYVFERLNEDGTIEANQYRNVEYFTFQGGEGTAAQLANDGPSVAATLTFSTPEIARGAMVPAEGVFIGNFGATDADTPLGDTLRYFIDGSGANNFSVDADGNLLLVNPVDFEAGPRVYTLSLLVVDSRGAQALSTITVNITNVDEPIGPVTVTGALTSAELAAPGTVVATAAASDVDGGSPAVYSLSDSAGGRYTIDASTGVISVANGNLLDFEQATSHAITVVATGSGGSTSSTTVTVAVTDVSPETITGTSANETIVAGAGNDSYTTNITTGGADSVNLGAGLDRISIDAVVPTQVRLTFTSSEVGNGQANDSNTLANQDGGLAVRVQAEDGSDGLTGPVTRTDDEGMVYVAGTGVTFDVRDLPSGVSRGNAFEVAILGTSAADTLTAVQNTRPYYFNAGAGNDSVTGGSANDFLVGGAGDDTLAGLGGNNSYIGGAGIDTVSYAAAPGAVYIDLIGSVSNNGYGGSETFLGGIENVIGSAGNDIIIGDNGNNVITGGGGSDYLIGRDGDDTLIGVAGIASAFQGGLGNDTYVIGNAGDSPLEFANEGIDTVRTTLSSYTLNNNIENLVYTGTAAFTGNGNGLANSLTGGTGNDTLTGGAGADTFNAIANNGLDRITDFVSGTDRIALDASYTHTPTVNFVSGAGAQVATTTDSTFLYDTTTGILSYDADGTGAGAAVQLFNLGAGTALVSSDLVFPILP